MAEVKLDAKIRTDFGKGAARRSRRENMVPGVIYGHGDAPKHVAIQTQFGDFDQKTMLRQIELWGSRIIPAIRKELGDSALAPAKLLAVG